MNKQTIIGGLVALIVVSGGAFYGGMSYAKSQTPTRGQFGNGQFIGNGQLPGGGMRGGMNGGFTAGEIISKDETSITIKMQDGSTKIVLVGSSAQVMKSTTGSVDDLAIGIQVTVTGSANSDGSVTAQSVQIRPAGASAFISDPQRQSQ